MPRAILVMKSLVFLVAFIAQVQPVFALQVMDDSSLSDISGRDGISIDIKLDNSSLVMSQAGLMDADGIPDPHLGENYSNPAGIVYAPTSYNSAGAAQIFSDQLFVDVAAEPVRVEIDAGEGSSGSVLNTNIQLPSDMRGIRINPFGLYLASSGGDIFDPSRPSLKTGVTKIIDVGVVDFLFAEGDPVSVNLQLGNQPQGHMFLVTGGTLLCASSLAGLCGPSGSASGLKVLSNNSRADSQIGLDFLLDARPYGGLGLSGFYADVDASQGIVIGKSGATGKFDLHLKNLAMGTAGTATADGLENGTALPSMGAEGVNISNLQVGITGK